MNRPVRWIALGCAAWTIWLLVGIVQAWIQQPIGEGGSAILASPWGQVTFVDLYAGFFVTAVWIVATERPWRRVVLWLVALGCLGNVAALGLFAVRGWHAQTIADVFVPRRRRPAN